MAIANEDGSIVLSTKVDTAGLSKGMTSMTGIASKLGGAMAAAFSVKMVANFAKESKNLYKIQMQNEVKLATVMRQRTNATNEQIQKVMDLASAEQQLGIIGDEVQLAGLQQLATFTKQQETIESLLPAMNNLIAQQYGFEASTESARNVANLMGKVLQGQTGALTRVGITFTEEQEQVLKYGNESERAATLAQVITDNVGEMNKALAKTDIGRQQQLSNTLGDIKEQFGEVVTQIEIFFLPFLQKLAEILSAIAVIFKSATNSIFNGGKENEAEWESIENNSNKTAENIEEQVENQKDLNDEMKKTLAGFDDIQILSANTAENTGGDNVNFGDLGSGGVAPDGSAYVEEINSSLTAIMGVVSVSLIALGCILLFTGNILWGLGFIIAGAATFGVTAVTLTDETVSQKVKDELSNALLIVGVVAIVIGILLCMAQLWGIGIGLIIIGVSSIVAPVALNWDGIKQQLQTSFGGWLVLGGIIAIVLGILLCFTPALPLGIGLIVLGAGAVVAPIVANWDAIWDAITRTFNAIMDWIKTYGLLVLGIILCLTGAGISLGIALIIKWAKEGAENGVPLATAIVDKVKEMWASIKAFWDKNIAPIFTAKFWLDLAKKCGNGLIGGFEAAINGIITMFEKMINWIVNGINSIGFDIPKWLGGGHFGFNIPNVSFGRVSIPRLAQGAVIPPNREFLAVLGDQKQGTNIEAPLQTIVDAFNIALQGNANYGGGNTEVVLELDGREFGRAVVEQGNRENRRIGTRLVIA